MPEDLKNTINYTLSYSPNHVSVSLSRHQKISLQWGYCTWKCIMTFTSNIRTRQVVYINVTLWHIRTTIVAMETHQSVLCFTTLSRTWHDFLRGEILNIRSVFWYYHKTTQVFSEILPKNYRSSVRYYHKTTQVFSKILPKNYTGLQWDITIKLHRSSVRHYHKTTQVFSKILP